MNQGGQCWTLRGVEGRGRDEMVGTNEGRAGWGEVETGEQAKLSVRLPIVIGVDA